MSCRTKAVINYTPLMPLPASQITNSPGIMKSEEGAHKIQLICHQDSRSNMMRIVKYNLLAYHYLLFYCKYSHSVCQSLHGVNQIKSNQIKSNAREYWFLYLLFLLHFHFPFWLFIYVCLIKLNSIHKIREASIQYNTKYNHQL